MINISDVTIEYKKNPIGIDILKPRISWKFDSNKYNVFQRTYQIQISEDITFNNILWDSDEVFSDHSILVEIPNLKLVTSMLYYLRVKISDQTKEYTNWSEINHFEMGILNKKEWVAEWISPPNDINGSPAPLLKYEFRINKKVAKARLYSTALGLYESSLNNQRVGGDYFTPGWTNYNQRLQYQTYDVTNLIVEGLNKWSVLLGNGWYKGNLAWEGKINIYGNDLAYLGQLLLEYSDGTKEIIDTNRNWKVSESVIRESEIYHGEVIDKTIDNKRTYDVVLNNYQKNKLIAQENEPVRITDVINPIELIKTSKDEMVIDFGQNLVGWVELTIEGQRGQKVSIEHAEVLDNNGDFYTGNLRSAKQLNEYTLSGNEEENFSPHFSFQGFRYIKLTGFKNHQVNLNNFKAMVLHSDMQQTGEFITSDKLINQLHNNIIWGMKGNFLDVPTDCPQRDERLGWTGDAQMFIKTATYLYNVGPFFTKWLHDLKSEQNEDGNIPFVVPNVLGMMEEPENKTMQQSFGSAAWGDATIICPWTIYQAYGDKRILEEQYLSMKNWIGYIKNQGDNPYLWNTGFHFGDWLALDAKEDSYIGATDKDYIATAFFAYSTSLVKKTASILGYKEDEKYYNNLEADIMDAFSNEFVSSNGKIKVSTQTSYILALMFNLIDYDVRSQTLLDLESLLIESNYHLTTGFVGTPYLNHVLTDNGLNKSAYKLLFQKDYPSWLYQITKGATTIWEHWDGIKEDGSFWSDDMNSFNHYAYGAIGDWLYSKVAGIRYSEDVPGYKEFIINPNIGEGLEWVKSSYESMYGKITSNWKTINNSVQYDIQIPTNTKARIHINDINLKELLLNNESVLNSEYPLLVDLVNNEIVLGSGKYKLETK